MCFDVKRKLEHENYIIVLDTNVFLNIYHYSPEFYEFALKCLEKVKDYIYLPNTVRIEYEKHTKKEFLKMKNIIKDLYDSKSKVIKEAQNKFYSLCKTLDSLHFEGVYELQENFDEIINKMEGLLFDYLDDGNAKKRLIELNSANKEDSVYKLFTSLIENEQIMPSVEQVDIFRWCDEGKKRYKKEIPPGFKDQKNKDGVQLYGDFIIWKEIIRFSKNNNFNVIFITDDAKSDWWEIEKDTYVFHSKLEKEFKKDTGNDICAFSSDKIYKILSSAYNIQKTSSVESILNKTDEDFYENTKDDIETFIEENISYDGNELNFIGENHIGTEGLDELEVTDINFIDAKLIDIDENIITYAFTYEVALEGCSNDYWGRDEDTKEIILSPSKKHCFSGHITVTVKREILDFMDPNLDSIIEKFIDDSEIEEIGYDEYDSSAEDYYNDIF